jgi:hypothetical protein
MGIGFAVGFDSLWLGTDGCAAAWVELLFAWTFEFAAVRAPVVEDERVPVDGGPGWTLPSKMSFCAPSAKLNKGWYNGGS